jgi:hypothetical protein
VVFYIAHSFRKLDLVIVLFANARKQAASIQYCPSCAAEVKFKSFNHLTEYD